MQTSKVSLVDLPSVHLPRAPSLEESCAVTLLKFLILFEQGYLAFLFCTGPANYAVGPAEQSMEGREWSWEQWGKGQGRCEWPYCSPQSLYQFELLRCRELPGKHKAVMVLSSKFLRFLGSLDRSKSKGRDWFSSLPTQSQIRNPPWSPICNFPTSPLKK